MLPGHQKKMYYNMIGAMSGQFWGHFMLYLIDSTKVFSSKVVKFGSMDIVELHGDILQPGGQLETPGLVLFQPKIKSLYKIFI